jgi:anti-sigma B factor antagonist
MTDTTPLETRTVRKDGTLIIEAAGEIDMATAPALATAINAADRTVRRVIVNLTEISFLDSSGLNTLIHCTHELEERDITVRVVSPKDENVRRVLEITQLIQRLNVVDSLDEAFA